ncbi:unnamed protein product [Adineta ricciae]|uniref:Uncharacterized protein n=1 Tax=Adineta ricciae TaxID=249248 RepID=A0A814N2Q7_ADIRI|nr:unnamed protein product [Adineta ricciae]CAF1309524.1 unnamed protein product [Adineta ricciae]
MRFCLTIYVIFVYAIDVIQSLKCYSCSGGHTCGSLFSPDSPNVKTVTAPHREEYFSCAISVTPEGVTSRHVIPSHACRSSSHQFCCNRDLCNSLPSPPLPALTARKCILGKCVMDDGICVDDDEQITVLSSATESCSITSSKGVYQKSFTHNCQPTVRDLTRHVQELSTRSSVMCCNSPECNREILTNAVKGSSLQCYTCDSRISGLAGCQVLDPSSPNVYKSGTSSPSESCATIVGVEGQDPVTKVKYPAFVIRTFISKCVDHSLGKVSYGGATFHGRIQCCKSHLCNKDTLTTKKLRGARFTKKLLLIMTVAIGLLVATIVTGLISFILYRKRVRDTYGSRDTKDPAESISLSRTKSLRGTAKDYPEQSAVPT